jgi:hypothetical protein
MLNVSHSTDSTHIEMKTKRANEETFRPFMSSTFSVLQVSKAGWTFRPPCITLNCALHPRAHINASSTFLQSCNLAAQCVLNLFSACKKI